LAPLKVHQNSPFQSKTKISGDGHLESTPLKQFSLNNFYVQTRSHGDKGKCFPIVCIFVSGENRNCYISLQPSINTFSGWGNNLSPTQLHYEGGTLSSQQPWHSLYPA